jgi:hypothetical protein
MCAKGISPIRLLFYWNSYSVTKFEAQFVVGVCHLPKLCNSALQHTNSVFIFEKLLAFLQLRDLGLECLKLLAHFMPAHRLCRFRGRKRRRFIAIWLAIPRCDGGPERGPIHLRRRGAQGIRLAETAVSKSWLQKRAQVYYERCDVVERTKSPGLGCQRTRRRIGSPCSIVSMRASMSHVTSRNLHY